MDFYFLNGSPPCHSVVMAAKALEIQLNTKPVDYVGGEHLKPEFLKINPQHTLPTIVDDGFALWESRAIITYLADKYGKTDSWYPKDPKKRAVVNQRLFFDTGLYQHFCDYYFPQLIAKAPANQEIFKKIEAAMGFLNTFLDGQKYVCGKTITLADISLVSTISCYESAKFNISKYPNVEKWYKHTTSVVPGFDLIQDGLAVFRGFVGTLDPVN